MSTTTFDPAAHPRGGNPANEGQFAPVTRPDQGDDILDPTSWKQLDDLAQRLARREADRIGSPEERDDFAQAALLELARRWKKQDADFDTVPTWGYAKKVMSGALMRASAEAQGSLPGMGDRSYERQALDQFLIDRQAFEEEKGRPSTFAEQGRMADKIIADAKADYHQRVADWEAAGRPGRKPSSRTPRHGFHLLVKEIRRGPDRPAVEPVTDFDPDRFDAARREAVYAQVVARVEDAGMEERVRACWSALSQTHGVGAPAARVLSPGQAAGLRDRYEGRVWQVASAGADGRLSAAELADFLPHYPPDSRLGFCDLLADNQKFASPLWGASLRFSTMNDEEDAA